MHIILALFVSLLTLFPLQAQRVEVRVATPNYMPAPVDSNSPAYWYNGQLSVLNSANRPLVSTGFSQFYPMETEPVTVNGTADETLWIEAAWLDDDGTLYGYYHQELAAPCPGVTLSMPRIGALMSGDGGRSWVDLGTILEAADPPDCNARNGFFAGGHGDFSVAVDPARNYIYLYFTNYGGDLSSQGVAVARMAFSDRYAPVGAFWKYHEGGWREPGLRGRVTAILPATVAWQRDNTDSFWGPSLHWNHHLQSWVMLLSRACCAPRWPQEGIYISYNPDLSSPTGWNPPERILKDIGFGPGWYPQVLGTMVGETDKVAGQIARLYVHGVSRWEMVFHRADGLPAPPPSQPAETTPPPSQPAESAPPPSQPAETTPDPESPAPASPEPPPPSGNSAEEPPPADPAPKPPPAEDTGEEMPPPEQGESAGPPAETPAPSPDPPGETQPPPAPPDPDGGTQPPW